MSDSAASGSTTCPQCGTDNIEVEPVQALTFCLDCGFVLSDEHLDISVLYEESGRRTGVLVAENDDGSRAATVGLPAGTKGFGPRGLKIGQDKVAARVRLLCGQLQVPPAVTSDAESTADQLLTRIYALQQADGKVSLRIANRDKLAAAAVYIAARFAQLPITAVDVALAIRVSTKTFGRAFRSAVKALGVNLPLTPPRVFLRSAAHKLCHNQAAQVAVERDAVALEAWLSSQPQHRGTPLLTAATALTIALEAHPPASGCKRKVKAKDVSKALHIAERHLTTRVFSAKSKLVEVSKALPWAEEITTQNVAWHLQTILKTAHLQPGSG